MPQAPQTVAPNSPLAPPQAPAPAPAPVVAPSPVTAATQAPAAGSYNGTFKFKGQELPIVNGVITGTGTNAGKKMFVSADGKVVFDDAGKVLGSLDADGNFKVVDKAQLDELAKKGVVKGEKPEEQPAASAQSQPAPGITGAPSALAPPQK